MGKHVWYVIEISRRGANEWCYSGTCADTYDEIMVALEQMDKPQEFEYRITKRTMLVD